MWLARYLLAGRKIVFGSGLFFRDTQATQNIASYFCEKYPPSSGGER
jgi:hypothetical protein